MEQHIFDEAGLLRETGSNTPILLNGSEGAWYVHSGCVDVFAVRLREGEPVSRRRHLCRFEAGRMLFGIAACEGYGLQVVGAMGTLLRRVEASWLRAAVWDAERAGMLAEHVNHWIERVAAGAFPFMPPKEHQNVAPGEEVLIQEGAMLRARDQVCWIRHLEGASRLMGEAAFPMINGDGPFPVNRTLWLQTAGVCRLQVTDTRRLLEEGEAFWEALERTHRHLLAGLAVHIAQERRMERERIRRKARTDAHALARGAAHLAHVMETDAGETEAHAPDPLLAACRRVGAAIGLEMKAPPRTEEDTGRRRDRLKEIARVSRVRFRKVALRGQWWKMDNGPMLGLLRDEETGQGRPVALLPEKGKRYSMYDPATGRTRIVDAEIVEHLHPMAYYFYRPFADKALTAWDVLKFGVAGCRKDLLFVLVLGLAGGLLNMITPIATGSIFNTVIPEADRSQLSQIMVALFAVAGAVALFQVTRGIAILRVESRMDASVQAAVWDRLLNLPTPFFRRFSAGDLAMRASGISTIRQLLSGVTVSSILGGLFSVFNFGLLFYYDSYLALWATGLTLVALAVSVAGSYFQLRHQRRIADLQSWLSGKVLQFITGITKLRVAGAESKAFERWARSFGEQRRLQYKARRIGNGIATFNAVFPILTSMVIFAVMIMVQDAGNVMMTGDFIAFNAALGTFTSSMLSMVGAFVAIQMAIPLYEQAKPVLETLPEVDLSKALPGTLTGEIEVKHVSFRYEPEGALILDDVSVQAHPGEFIALVGPSGSGKSTILRLLLGFETPESGSLYYDGQDLSGLDIQAVRRQIGVVLQNGRLMSGDIFTNIAGSSLATLDDAWEAARMAGLADDIKQMPMGMHTVVSEGGSTLSGGQRQRLMIARAIVGRPRILFFDEATSALDNRTQQIVSESLDNLQATRIVVAHRLSTIMHADRIYVIDKGRVVQEGTYETLMQEEEGIFAELARRQMT
ncbi:NHLP bacteriocin export ABC transporter permease/ATPase subunit [Rhodocaloribacter sp.]